jgi:predicted dehydrogenase
MDTPPGDYIVIIMSKKYCNIFNSTFATMYVINIHEGVNMNTSQKVYRIGFVGAGNITKLHYEGMKRHPDRVAVGALCDPNPDTLKSRAEEFSCTATFSDVTSMIREAGIDAAIVCTATHVRSDVLTPLIEAGIPVLCEKPLAETYAEAVGIASQADSHGIPVAVNQNFRRHFTFHIARDILAGGSLGNPLHLMHTACYMRHDTGWRLSRNRYVMAVMSIHWFDGYRYLLEDEPASIYCRHINSPATEGGDDTAVSTILTFSHGTVVSLSESFSSYTKQSVCALDCAEGGLIMNYGELTEIRTGGETVKHTNQYDKAEATYYVLDDLLNACEEKRAPETSVHDNLKSMRILEAAYRSCEERRQVDLEEIS